MPSGRIVRKSRDRSMNEKEMVAGSVIHAILDEPKLVLPLSENLVSACQVLIYRGPFNHVDYWAYNGWHTLSTYYSNLL